MSWYVYMVQCADNTLYTGITTDVKRRVAEHNGEPEGKGAKYTKARRPVKLVYKKRCKDRSSASQREYAVRTMVRREKIALIDKK